VLIKQSINLELAACNQPVSLQVIFDQNLSYASEESEFVLTCNSKLNISVVSHVSLRICVVISIKPRDFRYILIFCRD
jgi:hypothetical protein